MKISDIMTTEVVTLSPADNARQVAAKLAEHEIAGAPVVDEDGKVLGLVSEGDLLPRLRRLPFGRSKIPALFNAFADDLSLEELFRQSCESTAEELMTTPAITITPDRDLMAAALLMTEHEVNRLPVVHEDQTLAGILTRSDIVKALARGTE
jgi:CBS domain-containing protein